MQAAQARKPSAERHQGRIHAASRKKRPEGAQPFRPRANPARTSLELEPQSELDTPRIAVDGGSSAKFGSVKPGRDCPTARDSARCSRSSELDSIVANREAPEDAHVEVVFEGRGSWSPCCPTGFPVGQTTPDRKYRVRSSRAEPSRFATDGLPARALVQRSVIPADRKRRAGVDLEHTVDLPVLNNRCQYTRVVLGEGRSYRKPIEKLWVLS